MELGDKLGIVDRARGEGMYLLRRVVKEDNVGISSREGSERDLESGVIGGGNILLPVALTRGRVVLVDGNSGEVVLDAT